MAPQRDVTQALQAIRDGHGSAADDLLPLVYDELRDLAERFMRQERPNHTLQPTALVHEAYLRLVNESQIDWQGRSHFFAIAARLIRQILVNHAHAYRALKRGGGAQRITLREDMHTPAIHSSGVDLLDLEEALTDLAKLDERQCRVVELRFFGGLTVEEAASILDVSPRTVENDWAFAKAWLRRRLEPGGGT